MQILQTRSVGEAALARLLLALIRLHCRAASKAVLSIIKVEENWPIAVHQVQIGNIRVQGTTTLPVQYSASPHSLERRELCASEYGGLCQGQANGRTMITTTMPMP